MMKIKHTATGSTYSDTYMGRLWHLLLTKNSVIPVINTAVSVSLRMEGVDVTNCFLLAHMTAPLVLVQNLSK